MSKSDNTWFVNFVRFVQHRQKSVAHEDISTLMERFREHEEQQLKEKNQSQSNLKNENHTS